MAWIQSGWCFGFRQTLVLWRALRSSAHQWFGIPDDRWLGCRSCSWHLSVFRNTSRVGLYAFDQALLQSREFLAAALGFAVMAVVAVWA